MYALLLDYRRRPELRAINRAHQFVMQNIQQALRNCGVDNHLQGICDLTIGDRKVSGNALRCKKNWLIYHGTLICRDMDLTQISSCLRMPTREPDYRQRRSHAEFLTGIPIGTETLAQSLAQVWCCQEAVNHWPAEMTQMLVDEKYTSDSWNLKI